MSFGEQTLGGLYVARDMASALLQQGNLRGKPLSLNEALFMQAASEVLEREEAFHARQVGEITRISFDIVRHIAHGFVDMNVLANAGLSYEYDFEIKPGRPAHMYTPTEMGKEIVKLFGQNEEQLPLTLTQ